MKLLALLFGLFPHWIVAGTPFLAAGAEAAALSGIQLFASNSFSGINNISMQKPDKITLGLCLHKPYFLSEVMQLDGIFTKPYKQHHSVVYFRNLKAPSYSNSAFGLGIGFQIHPKIQTSIQTELQAERIIGYGTSYGNSWKLAFTTLPFSKWQIAWLIAFNLPDKLRTSISMNNVLGLQYGMNQQAKLIAEIQWPHDQTPVLKTGLSYKLNKQWQLFSGFTFSHAQLATGLTYKKNQISYGFAIRYHQVLGSGHAIHLTYDW